MAANENACRITSCLCDVRVQLRLALVRLPNPDSPLLVGWLSMNVLILQYPKGNLECLTETCHKWDRALPTACHDREVLGVQIVSEARSDVTRGELIARPLDQEDPSSEKELAWVAVKPSIF